MAITIRMRRSGARSKAFYHVVVADSRRARDGRFKEKLGYYDPKTDPPTFKIDRERAAHWLNQGAKASRTVAQLMSRYLKDEPDTQAEKSVDA